MFWLNTALNAFDQTFAADFFAENVSVSFVVPILKVAPSRKHSIALRFGYEVRTADIRLTRRSTRAYNSRFVIHAKRQLRICYL